MARRRVQSSTDSLELLLDTICNVFGGVILMAILVVLLTQTSAGRIPDPTPEEAERSLEARRLRFECQRLQERVADLSRHRDEVERTFRSTTSPTGERLASAVNEFREAIKVASQRVQATQKDTRGSQKDRTEAADLLRAAERLVREKTDELRRLEDELGRSGTSLPKQVRLPHRRGAAPGRACYYVIKGPRAYPLERVSWFGNAHRSGHCMATPLLPGRAARITPIEGRGYPVPQGGGDVEGFRRSLLRYTPDSRYVVFFVYNDSRSYAAFQALKDVVVNAHYRYVAAPIMPEGGAFTVHPVSHHETE